MNMKTDDEMYSSVLERLEEYERNKRRRNTILKRSAAIISGTAAVIAIGVFSDIMKAPEKPAAEKSGIVEEMISTTTSSTMIISEPTTCRTTSAINRTIPVTAVQTSVNTSSETSAVSSLTEEPSLSTHTDITNIVRTENTFVTSEMVTTTTTVTTVDTKGGIDMKKISAFITALTLTASLSPVNTYADVQNKEHKIMFTQNELYMFREYESEESVDVNGDGIFDITAIDPDINGDGVFDICDVFELRLYAERFTYCFEKYGSDQRKYAELEELYGGKANERILECFGANGAFLYMPVSAGDVDKDSSEGAKILARYYLYKNNSYPSESEIYSALENREFISSVSSNDIDSFVDYIDKLREHIVYADEYNNERVYSEEELSIFARFDSGETVSDINADGVFDVNDGIDVLLYYLLKEQMGQVPFDNYYFTEEEWSRIESFGDVTLDGVIDEKDYDILVSYYLRNTLRPIILHDEYINRISEHIRKKYPAEYQVKAEDFYNAYISESLNIKGDANDDGKVSLADAVAILQHIGNRDKYPLTAQGKLNADVDGVAGITANDALEIQKMDAEQNK